MFTNLLRRTRLADRLRAVWRHDADEAMKPLRKELRRLTREVEELQATLQDTAARAARGDRTSAQLRLILELNEHQRQPLAALPALLDERQIQEHVSRAIGAAEMRTDPFEHIVVQRLLPTALYDLLIAAIPPAVFFYDRDLIKQNLELPIAFGPALTIAVWNFVDVVIARRVIQPAVVDKFNDSLQRHYDTVFGPSFRAQANALPQLSEGGRLMLRRPGYHLPPHRDPKRSMLTCLLYLARPGDNEAHGTQLFRVSDDREASYKQTYYPEAGGSRCELATVVPFRPNTMLVFLNSRGAHGATIPADAGDDLERYSYQFYVAPENAALGALIRELPRDRRTMWQNKNKLEDAPTDATA
ncbi:MAG: hypothetical protein EXQ53_13425 [Acidobacteria bacterium]|nr:hypothetical protein [Acidobacteriota bacterium]